MQSQQSNSKKWNLSTLFKDENDPHILSLRATINEKTSAFISKWKDRKDYLNDTNVLLEALHEYNELADKYGSYGKEYYYYYLLTSLDENDPTLKAKYNTISALSKKLDNDLQFFSYHISKIPKEIQKKFLEAEELKDFHHYLERLFNSAKYLLSEGEEKIMNLKSKTSYFNWLQMTSGFLSKESASVLIANKEEQKHFEEIVSLLNSKNKKTRDSANEAFNSILNKHIDVGEIELNSILENKMIDDSIRNISRPDESRHLADDIDTEVVDKLIKVVSEHNTIAHSYYELKAKLLGVEKLQYHERNIEYGSADKSYTYEDAVELVSKVFKNLDAEFLNIFEGFISSGQIDVYPQKGKRGGAFCAHLLKSLPTYILLNYSNQLLDVLTIAHEVGHGINNELVKKKQDALNFGTPTSTAEVASTFMEDFVLEELMKEADEEMQLSLMMTKLNSDISSIFRQIAAYRFEQDLHQEFRKKGYLAKREIGKLFQKHMADYMGPFVEQSKGSENWWLYWTHIRYFFYNYSYASGLLISKALQSEVKKDHAFINKVKEFLSAGLSKSPQDTFQDLGIDISQEQFWLKGIKEIQLLLTKTEDLAKKLKKI
jgi:oligoendopeptidase F